MKYRIILCSEMPHDPRVEYEGNSPRQKLGSWFFTKLKGKNKALVIFLLRKKKLTEEEVIISEGFLYLVSTWRCERDLSGHHHQWPQVEQKTLEKKTILSFAYLWNNNTSLKKTLQMKMISTVVLKVEKDNKSTIGFNISIRIFKLEELGKFHMGSCGCQKF